ncbi:DUF126 domain-containing protein [Rhodobacteraceae bacterium NNCM2]|nr:DUF126 domain-containing protein [Coraliihabitans acroporae]
MTDKAFSWRGRGVVKGTASGPALLSNTSLSFLGDLDIRSGKVVGESSDLLGSCVTGAVLLLPATRGSAGAWRFLYQLKVHRTHPAAIVTQEMPDPSVVQGAILAGVPVVANASDNLWREIRDGHILTVDGTTGRIKASTPAPL